MNKILNYNSENQHVYNSWNVEVMDNYRQGRNDTHETNGKQYQEKSQRKDC